MRRTALTPVCLLWSLLGSLLANSSASASTLDECRRVHQDVTNEAPHGSYDAALCFFRAGSTSGDWPAALDALREARQHAPDDPWLVLVRAYALAVVSDPAAESAYVESIARFEALGLEQGELLAVSNLRTLRFEQGDVSGANALLPRLRRIGESSPLRHVQLRALLAEGRHLLDTRRDLDRARLVLERVHHSLTSDDPYGLRRASLNDLAQLDALTGLRAQALQRFDAFARLAQTHGDPHGEALAAINALVLRYELAVETPSPAQVERVQTDAPVVLDLVRAVGDVHLGLIAVRLQAQIQLLTDPVLAAQTARTCVTLAEPYVWLRARCRWTLARALAAEDPQAADAAAAMALEELRNASDGEPAQLADAWRHRLQVVWQTQPRPQAVALSEQGLMAFESLRALQVSELSRSAVFSTWARDYLWLVGRMLLPADGDAPDVDRAFEIIERARARSLLDSLHRGGEALHSASAEVLRARLTSLQKQLLQARSEHDKATLLAELADAERREARLRWQDPGDLQPLGLAEVQAAMGENDILLVMALGHWNSPFEAQPSGAWVMRIRHNDVRVFRTRSRGWLQGAARLFAGSQLDGQTFADIGHQLYAALLDEALADVEPGARLIISPDDPLQRLPYGALAIRPDGTPLATRFSVSVVPSASAWVRLLQRRQPEQLSQAPQADSNSGALANGVVALALPDPLPAEMSALGLPALPESRSEAGRLVAALGDVAGFESVASEAALKRAGAVPGAVLHFATHAVLDSEISARSALLIEPGDEREDGVLQAREIADLELRGQLVTLASCQSALGDRVRGEGVLGLARSFLVAGGSTVVGSTWPVRDQAAAVFFDRFYQQLGTGLTVEQALSEAQMALRASGWPPEDWAGYIVLGDGSWRLPAAALASPGQLASLLPWMLIALGLGCLMTALYRAWIPWRR